MEFQIPQFIEREPKIIGPLTFKQFIFLAIVGGICTLFYFSLPKFLFYILTFILFGISLVFIFVKIEGQSIPLLLKNFFFFSFSPKLYLWKKKEISSFTIKKEEKKGIEKERTPLKVAERSKLKSIFTKLETTKPR